MKKGKEITLKTNYQYNVKSDTKLRKRNLGKRLL